MTVAVNTRGTQEDILRQIVRRLRERIVEYNESTCFLCDQPIPNSWPSGPVCCTVSLGGGSFSESLFAGGGHATLFKSLILKVSPFVRVHLDKIPEIEASLVGKDKGLVSRFEGKILAALLCEERDGDIVAWEPCNDDGEGILRNQLAPVRTTPVRPTPDGAFLGFDIDFTVDFDWLLQ